MASGTDRIKFISWLGSHCQGSEKSSHMLLKIKLFFPLFFYKKLWDEKIACKTQSPSFFDIRVLCFSIFCYYSNRPLPARISCMKIKITELLRTICNRARNRSEVSPWMQSNVSKKARWLVRNRALRVCVHTYVRETRNTFFSLSLSTDAGYVHGSNVTRWRRSALR